MSVDELLERFQAELRRTGEADPRTYLSQVQGAERAELAALLDVTLEHAPDPPFDAARFAAWRESAHGKAAIARVARATGREKSLAELRNAAEIPRSKLVAGLVQALGLGEGEPAVRRRYHQLESGQLEPTGVSARVWSALGELLGHSAETVRAAAGAAGPAAGAAGAVFARTAATADAASAPPAPASQEPHDPEVDALFLGPGG